MKALTRDRNLRYQTAAAMHRDLNRFLNRHYPDFTPHDFAVFIKTLYTDEILELRKRLIEYAKIPFRPTTVRGDDSGERTSITSFPQVPDSKTKTTTVARSEKTRTSTTQAKTEVQKQEHTLTATETFSDVSAAPKPAEDASTSEANTNQSQVSLSREAPEMPEGLDPSAVGILDNRILQGSMQQHIVVNPKPPPSLSQIDESSKKTGAKQVLDSGVLSLEIANAVSAPHRTQARPRSKTRKSSSSISLMIVVAFAIVSYVVLSTYMPKQTAQIEILIKEMLFKKTTQTARNAPTPAPDNSVKIPLPSMPFDDEAGKSNQGSKTEPVLEDFKTTVGLVVNSIPAGAEIYINGLNTGKTTPSRVEVPADTPFSVALKLERYLDYSKGNLTAERTGRSFNATLQKAMVAYVDIDVKPSRNARVFVNGRLLQDETLPIARYAVPAGTPIVVRAENPYTGETAEQTITLREDQRSNVLLRLGNSRKPSSQK